jgi:hypothetical protein
MRIVAAGLVAIVVCGTVAAPAEACGDKLLVIGRRVKRVPQSKHPATVLIYLRPGSALPTAAKEMHLETTLRQAGHTVDTVDQAEQLRGQLAAGRYDFVLTDLPDAAPVAREAGSTTGAPAIIPVAYKVPAAELRDSLSSYPVVIQAGTSKSYLSALDVAMRERENSR